MGACLLAYSIFQLQMQNTKRLTQNEKEQKKKKKVEFEAHMCWNTSKFGFQ